MSQFFRIEVDEAALTDELFAFVTDPHPSRNDRPVVDELHNVAPEMVDVMKNAKHWDMIFAVIGLPISLLHLIAGVMLVKYKKSGPMLAIGSG